MLGLCLELLLLAPRPTLLLILQTCQGLCLLPKLRSSPCHLPLPPSVQHRSRTRKGWWAGYAKPSYLVGSEPRHRYPPRGNDCLDHSSQAEKRDPGPPTESGRMNSHRVQPRSPMRPPQQPLSCLPIQPEGNTDPNNRASCGMPHRALAATGGRKVYI